MTINFKEHLLICLAEECSEVIKICTKSLRFGLNDVNILYPEGPSNIECLEDELNDLYSVVEILVSNNILANDWLKIDKQKKKRDKVYKFASYAQEKGVLKER